MSSSHSKSSKGQPAKALSAEPPKRFIHRLAGKDSTSPEEVVKVFDVQLSQQNVNRSQWIPQLFWWSSRHGNEELCDALLSCETKAAINFGRMAGETGAHMAAFWGKKILIPLYQRHKMSIDIQDDNGLTPLFWALASDQGPESHKRQKITVDSLIKAGATPDSATPSAFTNGLIRDCLSEEEDRWKWFGNDAEEISGSFRRLEREFNRGSRGAKKGDIRLFKNFWLWKFSSYNTQNSFQLCLDLLESKNSPPADVCKPLFVTSAFHRAARFGNTRLLKYILDKGFISDIDCRDQLGWTALHNASWHIDTKDCVELLLENGAASDIASTEGTAVEIARDYNNVGVSELLQNNHDVPNRSTKTFKDNEVVVVGHENVVNVKGNDVAVVGNGNVVNVFS